LVLPTIATSPSLLRIIPEIVLNWSG
jgi:hypothetical protein